MLWLFYSPIALLAESLGLVVVMGLLALAAPRLLEGEPGGIGGLRLSMLLTGSAVVLGSLGVLGLAAEALGAGIPSLEAVVVMVFLFMLAQWLFSPYLINAVYKTRPPDLGEEWLVLETRRLAERAGIRPPKIVVADLSIPNAFAYGSPLTGNYIAVTRGLLRLMPREEVSAVIGHELGHLRHRDVAVILALGVLPTALYFLGRMLVEYGFWTSGYSSRERDYSPLALMAIGFVLLVAGFLFHFMVTHFSRLREYYADAHSAEVTGNPRLLQRALARLHLAYRDSRMAEELRRNSTASTLFIVNYLIDMYGSRFYDGLPGWGAPREWADIDSVVEELKAERTSGIAELFSTHPPIPKRLRFLDRLAGLRS